MGNEPKKPMGKTGKTILFYIDIVLILVALFLVIGNLYGSNSSTGLFAGFVIGIYAIIGLFRDNPYKKPKNAPTVEHGVESDSKSSGT